MTRPQPEQPWYETIIIPVPLRHARTAMAQRWPKFDCVDMLTVTLMPCGGAAAQAAARIRIEPALEAQAGEKCIALMRKGRGFAPGAARTMSNH